MNISIKSLYNDLDTVIEALKHDQTKLKKSRQIVDDALLDGKSYYGINTGFGALATKRIDNKELAKLQHNLLLSHACGMGSPVPKTISKLMLALKICSLGKGFSGVSLETFNQLITLYEKNLIPWVPSRGSVGASGDLAPLAHLCLPLIGAGKFWGESQQSINSKLILEKNNITPIQLQAKDGLALINGTQLMSAYGSYVLEHCQKLVKTADIIATMSLEALQGSNRPFDAKIHAIRPHQGQKTVASNIRVLLANSEILESHRECGKVQDPYCLRCIPQVHGATRDSIDHAVKVVETEINSVTDNPLVFENGDIISGGNFHGQPLALVLDFAAIALAELGSISERRTYLLLEGHDGLPKLLMEDTGINSGFMIPQYTSAALVSENKILCHPASVDSIPTSLGQEDHVSMGSISAIKLLKVLQNLRKILAIELITAAQALDYRKPMKPGKGAIVAHNLVRKMIHHNEADYALYDDLITSEKIVIEHALVAAIEQNKIVLQ